MPPLVGLKKRWRRPKKRLGLLTLLAVVVLSAGYLGVLELSRPHVGGDRLRFDSFVNLANGGQIRSARILDQDAYVVGTYVPAAKGGSPAAGARTGLGGDHGLSTAAPQVTPPQDADPAAARPFNAPLLQGTQGLLLDLLLKNQIPTTIDQQVGKRVASLASVLLPGLIIVVLFVYLVLSYRRGSGLFGIRSGARKVTSSAGGVTFADVAGQEAAITELREIKAFLADPSRFSSLGAAAPKGILLYGPPGCGKTLLARALASEAGASFYSISGSDFVELYVGVGAARVRDLFREARENAPALIFIDELDSIGRARGTTGATVSHGEQEQGLNQILAEMDGFSPADGILVIGATNRPDVLDRALLRPGRFDKSVGLELPDEKDRLAILALHARGKPLDPAVDLADVARRAIGLTGADLASVLNEGAMLAARASRPAVAAADLDIALRHILEAPDRQRRLSLRGRTIGRRFASEERVTFADVAGTEEILEELTEVKDYLAQPRRFADMGARVPRGILLSGPPGCGKTLLARAVAGEANAAFLSVAGSEFVEVFAGQGAARARELFAEAESVAPAIVFIDEIDAIGARRGGEANGHREHEQTLNQILIELDGFEPRKGVIVMAATNRPDILDPALVRPGRFDRRIVIPPPDRAGRLAILALHAHDKNLAADVDLKVVAGLTPGLSGADLAAILNDAALLATRRSQTVITMDVVDEALDRATLGTAARAPVLSEDERRNVALHEAGHAVVALALPGAIPPRKLTIMARGATLGHCQVLDDRDQVTASRTVLIDRMAVSLGGRLAETLVLGEPQAGSAVDLAGVRRLAQYMVCEEAMTEGLGLLAYPDGTGVVQGGYSEEARRTVDAEVRQLVEEASERAQRVLSSSRGALDRVVNALLERETLAGVELVKLVATPLPPRPADSPASSPSGRETALGG